MLQLITNNKYRSYHPLIPDTYLHRLAVTSRYRGVHAIENIYDCKNELCAREHELITHEHVVAMLNNKLQNPIESVVYIDRELTGQELRENFITRIFALHDWRQSLAAEP
ncbi:MAG: hypothetical protein EOO68_33120, partial [Moraxellaceae bacterium]